MRSTLERIAFLAAAMRAHDAAFALEECDACGATYDPIVFGWDCKWCAESERRQLRWQREMLLEPAFLGDDYDELVHDGPLRFYAEHVKRSIEAGLITMREADHAFRRVGRWQQHAECA